MSYAPAFTEQARADLRRMEPWLQEETLDELESLAANPPTPRHRHLAASVYDFVRERGGVRFYVSLTVAVDAKAQVLTVTEIGLYARQI